MSKFLVMAHLSFQGLVFILTIGPISQVNISFLIYISSTITLQGTMSDCENFHLPENSNRPLTLGYFQKQVWNFIEMVARHSNMKRVECKICILVIHLKSVCPKRKVTPRHIGGSGITECAQNCNWLILDDGLPCNSFIFDPSMTSCTLARWGWTCVEKYLLN